MRSQIGAVALCSKYHVEVIMRWTSEQRQVAFMFSMSAGAVLYIALHMLGVKLAGG